MIWRAEFDINQIMRFRTGAKIVRHGRYITFQLAEVAIPRSLFANILH